VIFELHKSKFAHDVLYKGLIAAELCDDQSRAEIIQHGQDRREEHCTEEEEEEEDGDEVVEGLASM
jgi:hypothetical protein